MQLPDAHNRVIVPANAGAAKLERKKPGALDEMDLKIINARGGIFGWAGNSTDGLDMIAPARSNGCEGATRWAIHQRQTRSGSTSCICACRSMWRAVPPATAIIRSARCWSMAIATS
jgi:hypothetical protein